mmetsp:Transcript_99229/g.303410  ORF Transcript_99229/g.303410 Transcript_99229/m.303410 type:complete len:248 (+) Transcript_99229:267-1010(+)
MQVEGQRQAADLQGLERNHRHPHADGSRVLRPGDFLGHDRHRQKGLPLRGARALHHRGFRGLQLAGDRGGVHPGHPRGRGSRGEEVAGLVRHGVLFCVRLRVDGAHVVRHHAAGRGYLGGACHAHVLAGARVHFVQDRRGLLRRIYGQGRCPSCGGRGLEARGGGVGFQHGHHQGPWRAAAEARRGLGVAQKGVRAVGPGAVHLQDRAFHRGAGRGLRGAFWRVDVQGRRARDDIGVRDSREGQEGG